MINKTNLILLVIVSIVAAVVFVYQPQTNSTPEEVAVADTIMMAPNTRPTSH